MTAGPVPAVDSPAIDSSITGSPTVHFLVPAGINNPARPSGGNVYDRRLATALPALGWQVVEHPVAGSWPRPGRADADALAVLLSGLPDGALVLIDGLIALAGTSLPLHADRLHVVVLVHMLFASADDGGTRVALERTVLRGAAAVVTTSWWTKRLIIQWHGVAPGRIAVVEPGADRGRLSPGTAGGGGLVCVGPVTAAKGYGGLVAALILVADQQWECTCAGALDLEPDFVRELRQRADEGGIGDRVQFTGALKAGDLSARYAAADVLLLVSRRETYGMVVTEAIAHGIPVIATDVGGIPEAMGRGASGTVPGLLVPPDNPAALAAALCRWFGDAELRRELRNAAVQRRETLGNWEGAAARLSDVLLSATVTATPTGIVRATGTERGAT